MTERSAVMEGSFMQVHDLAKDVSENDLVICLGFGGRKLDDVAGWILEDQQAKDYTIDWFINQFKKHFYDLADSDMDNMLFCRELGLGYYDVFGRREEACREAMGAVEVWMRR